MSALERPPVTKLELAATEQLVRQHEHFALAVFGRIESGQTAREQAIVLKSGIDQARELHGLRDRGYPVSSSTVEIAWGALFEGLDRLIELMPPDERPQP